MKSEKEKMMNGELYKPADPEIAADRLHARKLFFEINHTPHHEDKKIKTLLKKLIPDSGKNLWIEPPFYCDYGYNLKLGDDVFMNFNCTALDVMPITIGNRTMLGPNVQLYAATHPINAVERSSGVEYAKPIVIGDDVWVGGNTTICPGVTIGSRSIIGAGSVVTKDIPSDVIAAGNPCKVIRNIDE